MPTSQQFKVGLYREHLAEASFLYELRQTHLLDPEVTWPALRHLEERFEAHLDALVIGGDLALEVCRQAEDSGEKHAALCTFCRHDLKDDGLAFLNGLDPSDGETAAAAARALRSEAPAGWRDSLLQLLHQGEAHLTPVISQTAGFRRYPCEELLARRLATNPPSGRADLAWALGRVGSMRSAPLLSALLDTGDEPACEAAAIALLRLGDDQVLTRALRDAPARAWARRALAIGGNPRSVPVLLEQLEDGGDPDTVLALGLLGDLSAVGPLLQLLEHDTVGAPAAIALNTITGAELYAHVFVPDHFDPDELSDEEREAFERDGTLPTRAGEPYGNWERSPVRDQVSWQTWFAENKHRFSREHRWRMGQPYGPSSLLACLKSPTSPYAVRSATYDELVVRYRFDVPFEADLRVSQQDYCLNRAEDWVARQSRSFDAGRWYFAGHLQG